MSLLHLSTRFEESSFADVDTPPMESSSSSVNLVGTAYGASASATGYINIGIDFGTT
jgi:hypothetical protein